MVDDAWFGWLEFEVPYRKSGSLTDTQKIKKPHSTTCSLFATAVKKPDQGKYKKRQA